MRPLELWHLKRFCDKHGIDYQEIDNTLTYWENKEHLKSFRLPPKLFDAGVLDDWADVLKEEQERMAELQEQYMKEHFLCYYITCRIAGETRSKDTGEVSSAPQMFSLKAMAPIGFSLKRLCKA